MFFLNRSSSSPYRVTAAVFCRARDGDAPLNVAVHHYPVHAAPLRQSHPCHAHIIDHPCNEAVQPIMRIYHRNKKTSRAGPKSTAKTCFAHEPWTTTNTIPLIRVSRQCRTLGEPPLLLEVLRTHLKPGRNPLLSRNRSFFIASTQDTPPPPLWRDFFVISSVVGRGVGRACGPMTPQAEQLNIFSSFHTDCTSSDIDRRCLVRVDGQRERRYR